MSDSRFAVIFTGQLKPDSSTQAVICNLVLDMGLSQEKASRLIRMGRVVLKRCSSIPEAERLAERFDHAGALCVIEDRLADESSQDASEAKGESSLVSFLSKFISTSRSAA